MSGPGHLRVVANYEADMQQCSSELIVTVT